MKISLRAESINHNKCQKCQEKNTQMCVIVKAVIESTRGILVQPRIPTVASCLARAEVIGIGLTFAFTNFGEIIEICIHIDV